ncbi:hypothetical protein F4778DRAFT_795806 [Xylariomycetidae sp. FL2044]|nr:hypothetical protein F4778DRAFT_795806 [Xylariomycetidae sp. FL2044]
MASRQHNTDRWLPLNSPRRCSLEALGIHPSRYRHLRLELGLFRPSGRVQQQRIAAALPHQDKTLKAAANSTIGFAAAGQSRIAPYEEDKDFSDVFEIDQLQTACTRTTVRRRKSASPRRRAASYLMRAEHTSTSTMAPPMGGLTEMYQDCAHIMITGSGTEIWLPAALQRPYQPMERAEELAGCLALRSGGSEHAPKDEFGSN